MSLSEAWLKLYTTPAQSAHPFLQDPMATPKNKGTRRHDACRSPGFISTWRDSQSACYLLPPRRPPLFFLPLSLSSRSRPLPFLPFFLPLFFLSSLSSSSSQSSSGTTTTSIFTVSYSESSVPSLTTKVTLVVPNGNTTRGLTPSTGTSGPPGHVHE